MRRFATRPLVAVAAGTILFLLVISVNPEGASASRTWDQTGQLVAALLAALSCGYRARVDNDQRCSWLLLSASTGSWAIGQAIWCYLQLIKGINPFPSPAIPFFMLLCPLCVTAVLLLPLAQSSDSARWRILLDGVLVAGSTFILSWATALGQAIDGKGETRFAYILALYFPVSDLILITVSILVAAKASARVDSTVYYVAAAMACLAISDSGYAYLSASGQFDGGSPIDAGWCAAFFLITAAAVRRRPARLSDERVSSVAESLPRSAQIDSYAGTLLPYVPAVLAFIVVAVGQVADPEHQGIILAAAALVVLVLLTRQLLAVLDHHALVDQLLSAQDELRYQAYHDPLTGLVNRALFQDRLDRDVQLHQRNQRPLSLLYCDLDNFKPINDQLGHDAGDTVLVAVARHLLQVTRATDTVARLGGDEFALLLDGDDTSVVVTRIFTALSQPIQVGTGTVMTDMSIGAAVLTAGDATISALELIHRADTAMYEAKHTGRGQCVTWTSRLSPAGM